MQDTASEAMQVTGIRAATIVTLDAEGSIDVDGGKIRIAPAWRWLTAEPVDR